MPRVLVIGSGIAGMSCAIRCAEHGAKVMLVSPYPSERAQSVMAAGGINAVMPACETGDSLACHIEDTLRGGSYIAGEKAVLGLCSHASEIVSYLERIGTVFTVDEHGVPIRRAFGGQSHKRTYYCGSGTGKLIVSALVMEARRFEAAGIIERRLGRRFYSALIQDGAAYGALFFNELSGQIETVYADAVVMATGGLNALFGKTTGSTLCDGYAAGRLLLQGVELKNLEFIQYHPTTIETAHKRMLVSEAARGEGGRLFYIEGDERVYFMEDKFGPNGNLMTRDVVSREIAATGRDVFLDVSFLDSDIIKRRLGEVRELCLKYRGVDITSEPIPIAPSVHFFMGGIAVHLNHETKIRNLFAVGECASMYHGANRLGGNSLLAAMYSGRVAADEVAGREFSGVRPVFSSQTDAAQRSLEDIMASASPFPSMYVRDLLADTMRESLGIVRNEDGLKKGIADVDYYLSVAGSIKYDSSAGAYANYSLDGILATARAALACAEARKESRGAHYRDDYPETDETKASATIIAFDEGYRTWFDEERKYES